MTRFESLVLLMSALLSALGPTLASPALAADDPGARIPVSIEVWVEGIPDGAMHEAAKLRGAWTLYVDDLRFTQSVDAQAGRAATLLGPLENDGDFESGGGGLNAYLAQSLSVVEASSAVPDRIAPRRVGDVCNWGQTTVLKPWSVPNFRSAGARRATSMPCAATRGAGSGGRSITLPNCDGTSAQQEEWL